MNGFSAADMSTAAANGHGEGNQAGYADAVKAMDHIGDANKMVGAAQEPIGYRWRHSASEPWQYSNSPCGWEHQPLYAAPVAAAPVVPVDSDAFAYLVDEVAAEHGEMLDDGGPSGWSFTCEDIVAFAKHLMSDYKGMLVADAYAIARAEAKRDSTHAAPVDLHAHLLHMLGAKDHEDAGRIIGELHAASMSTPAAEGIDLPGWAFERPSGADVIVVSAPNGKAWIAEPDDRLHMLSAAMIDASSKGDIDPLCAAKRPGCDYPACGCTDASPKGGSAVVTDAMVHAALRVQYARAGSVWTGTEVNPDFVDMRNILTAAMQATSAEVGA